MNGPAIKSISCRQLYELSRERHVDLIDVRTPDEFRDARASIARNVPLDSLEPAAVISGRNDGQPLYFICQMGGRSAHACLTMMAAGYPDVVNVEGGTDAWQEAGLPTEHGR